MAMLARNVMLVAALVSTAGCSTFKRAWVDRDGYYTRNLPDLDDQDVNKFALRQNRIWDCFVALAQARAQTQERADASACANIGSAPNVVKSKDAATTVVDVADPVSDTAAAGLTAGGTPIPAYSEVVAAGINYVDVRCDRFVDALFWFNRMRETASREIQFVGAASAAALTILKASEELIGLAPLGIGLLDQTVNNIGRGLLYDLPPHIVRTLVEKQQQAYLQAVAKEYTSRPHAMQTIQGYAALCLPASIETEVNRSIEAAEYKPVPWQDPKAFAQPQANGDGDGKKNGDAGTPDGTSDKGTPPPNHVPAVKQDK